MYKCPECDYTSEYAGTCLQHNVELVIVEGEAPAGDSEVSNENL